MEEIGLQKSLEQYRGTAPNYDDQSLLHTGDWPYGRTNHYYFDLNRDWFYLTQPETQGRVKLINQWRPQILVDGHEMGGQDTFMTGPPREPINKNIDYDLIKWGNVFAQDQAQAFDKKIGGFIQVNGTRIFIQDIRFMFNLEEALVFSMSSPGWLKTV